MNWYLKVLRQYGDFKGRARRMEYWMFVLFNVFISIILLIIDNLVGIAFKDIDYGPLYLTYCLFIVMPSLAVAVRRLHDSGRSGWWILISLIPFLGGIWLLVLLLMDSDPGDNKYGPNPKITAG